MLIRIVRMEFDEDRLEEFKEVFQEARPKIKSQPGCRYVDLRKDASHPHVYYTVSGWDNEEGLEKYRQSELFEVTWKKTKACFNGRPQAFSIVRP